jgi:hypothetical protein
MTDKIAAQTTQSANPPAAEEGPKLAKIVTTKERERFIDLEYPVEYDGTLYTSVRIRRVTGTDIEDYAAKVGTPEAAPIPPTIDCPFAVWKAMDADDVETVLEASMDFLPRRMKTAADPI